MRYWENWDKGTAAKDIDDYWLKSESAWRNLIANEIIGVVKDFPVLEIGSGSGLICQELIARGMAPADYTGGDISEEMLKIAKSRLPQVSFKKLDILKLDLPDDAFPTVICVHVLQHLPSFEAALDEMVRVAGKKLYVACWFAPHESVSFSEASDKWSGQRFYNNRYSKVDWEDRLRQNDKVVGIQWKELGGSNATVEITMR